jgi:hypothetical protein
MKTIIIFIIIFFTIIGLSILQTKKALEYGYFNGQQDAINGDIRIKQIDSTCYIWIKSPWDDPKTKVLYQPNCVK